jgi:hypothetical protein
LLMRQSSAPEDDRRVKGGLHHGPVGPGSEGPGGGVCPGSGGGCGCGLPGSVGDPPIGEGVSRLSSDSSLGRKRFSMGRTTFAKAHTLLAVHIPGIRCMAKNGQKVTHAFSAREHPNLGPVRELRVVRWMIGGKRESVPGAQTPTVTVPLFCPPRAKQCWCYQGQGPGSRKKLRNLSVFTPFSG